MPSPLTDKDFANAPLTDADMSGSVFQSRSDKLKNAGRKIAEVTAGLAVTGGTALATGGASLPIQIGAAAASGAAALYVEAGVGKALGDHIALPTARDALKGAAFNAALTGIGGLASPGKASAVADEIKALPPEAQTPGNIRQAMRNRDFWKGMGLNDDQIDQALKSPDLNAQVEQSIKAGENYKGAYQATIDNTRANFKTRYDTLLGPHADAPVDTKALADQYRNLAEGKGAHELTPSFRSYLNRKADELNASEDSVDLSKAQGAKGGAIRLTQKQVEKMNARMSGDEAPPKDAGPQGIQGLRDLRTDLRESVPSGATNLDKQAAKQLTEQISQIETDTLKAHGATPEQIGGLKALDQEYGRFQDVLSKMDPRSEHYGPQVADALFDPMVKDPAMASNFIRMAKEAENARPGEVMPQFRQAFLDKAIAESRIATEGRPVEEMKALQKLQTQWGGDKNLGTILNQLFPNSPLKDGATLSKVLGSLSRPDETAAKTAQGISPFGVPHWLIKIGGAYAMYSAITGSPTGPWSDMHKNPGRFLMGMAALYAGTSMAGRIYSSADTSLKRAYTDFLLNPNSTTLSKTAQMIGAGTSSLVSMPTPEQAAANR